MTFCLWRCLTRISPLVLPNLTKTLGWVGGKTDLGEISQKKTFFFGSPPKLVKAKPTSLTPAFGLWVGEPD